MVIGFLTENEFIDETVLKSTMEITKQCDLYVTFHRAIDICKNDIIKEGIIDKFVALWS